MEIFTIVLQVFLGLMFLFAGVIKVVGVEREVVAFQGWGYPHWFRILTGALQFFGAVGIIVGIWFPLLAVGAGTLLAVVMIGAVLTLLTRSSGDKSSVSPLVPFVFAVLAAVAAGLRFSGM